MQSRSISSFELNVDFVLSYFLVCKAIPDGLRRPTLPAIMLCFPFRERSGRPRRSTPRGAGALDEAKAQRQGAPRCVPLADGFGGSAREGGSGRIRMLVS